MIDPKEAFRFENIRDEKGWIIAEWTVPDDFPYFDGHFPGKPVLPAVAILDGTIELLRIVLDSPRLELDVVHSAKFSGVVKPNFPLHICLREDSPHWEAEWRSRDTAQVLCSLSLSLRL